KYITAATMSRTLETTPIGFSDCRTSFESSLCSGVSTTPGATAFTRMPSLAYSIARCWVIVSSPPLVIMGTAAVTPRIGLRAAAAIVTARAFAEIEALRKKLELENEYLREEVTRAGAIGELVGRSPALEAVA